MELIAGNPAEPRRAGARRRRPGTTRTALARAAPPHRPDTADRCATGPAARCSVSPSGDALGAPAENMRALRDPPPLGPDRRVRQRRPGRHRRHGVRDLLRAAAGPARLGADRRPRSSAAWHQWIADRDEGPFRGAGLQRARHPGEPAPGPGRPHLRPAPARLERRTGDARGAVRRLRGGPARGGRPPGRDRRHGQPRRRGHLRRPGGGGRGGRGDGGARGSRP